MRFVHIIPERATVSATGAPMRGAAINTALRSMCHMVTLCVADYMAAAGLRLRLAPSYIEAEIPSFIIDKIVTDAQLTPQDIVVVEGIALSAISYRFSAMGAKVILDAHNVESILLRQIDRAKHPILAPLIRPPRWHRAVQAERALLQSVTAIWACSAADAHQLRAFSGKTVPARVVPNPVPPWCADSAPRREISGINALFIGHLGYGPNINAALRCLQHMLPQLRAAVPAAQLTIAGRTPHNSLRRVFSQPQHMRAATLIADPIDLAPIYATASVAIMPLREGGGTRIKVLEALALGLPIIATAKAVEGLMLTDGREYLNAETDAQFVAAILRLYNQPELARTIAAAGRAFVRQHHSPAAIRAAISAALTDVAPVP